jgi:hypothetical protein
MVLSAYRSQDGIEQSLRAFGTPEHDQPRAHYA